ncbi:MAG TPA: response regulator transcription factor [Caulobacteraceae bacterium]|jgi:DNA-binding response OmpR family regulator|nr:response regulator transcription factor [Caulobacteraceae bacterium]
MRILYVSEARPDAYLVAALREAGHLVEAAADPADGPVMAGEFRFDAAILDWSRPSETWARNFVGLASIVVVICARGVARERIDALRAGADVCFVRPFAFAELEARLQALRRRTPRGVKKSLDFQLAAAHRTIAREGAEIVLSAVEFRMLQHLADHAGEVVAIATLRSVAWGDGVEPAAEPVHRCAARLRRKLVSLGVRASIEASPGHGYALRASSAIPPV